MNDTNPQPEHEPTPLDAFEQHWVEQLAHREPDLTRSEEAFVKAVLDRHAQTQAGSAVIARIGSPSLRYVVAAGVAIAACVGAYVLSQNAGQTPDQNQIAEQPTDQPQPDDNSPVVSPDRPKVELGKLIAKAQTTLTQPAANLTTTVRDAPDALSLDNLFELLGNPVPDLKKILAPLEPKHEQSRA